MSRVSLPAASGNTEIPGLFVISVSAWLEMYKMTFASHTEDGGVASWPILGSLPKGLERRRVGGKEGQMVEITITFPGTITRCRKGSLASSCLGNLPSVPASHREGNA